MVHWKCAKRMCSKKTPFALFEVFHLMQKHSEIKDISPDTARLIRANLGEINRTFRKDITNRSLFMEIIRYKDGQTQRYAPNE